jgi:DNA-binding IclR family transcriptional regulator
MTPILKVWMTRASSGALRLTERVRRKAVSLEQEERAIQHLARYTSGPVSDLSRSLRLPAETTVALLAAMEQRGLVRLSADKGVGNVRIAALTAKGRQQATPERAPAMSQQ